MVCLVIKDDCHSIPASVARHLCHNFIIIKLTLGNTISLCIKVCKYMSTSVTVQTSDYSTQTNTKCLAYRSLYFFYRRILKLPTRMFGVVESCL